jgi:hypothetical protein
MGETYDKSTMCTSPREMIAYWISPFRRGRHFRITRTTKVVKKALPFWVRRKRSYYLGKKYEADLCSKFAAQIAEEADTSIVNRILEDSSTTKRITKLRFNL